jgi:uncharacterized protein
MRTVARRKLASETSSTGGIESSATPAVKRYIESSALVAALLEDDTAARAAIGAPGVCITSALTVAEASRAVLRARISARITVEQERAAMLKLQQILRQCHVVDVTEEILAHAGRQFPVEPLRTLDAIHLATAQALGEPPALVSIVTRDIRVGANANALGHPVE